jgi:hypothetical protein
MQVDAVHCKTSLPSLYLKYRNARGCAGILGAGQMGRYYRSMRSLSEGHQKVIRRSSEGRSNDSEKECSANRCYTEDCIIGEHSDKGEQI